MWTPTETIRSFIVALFALAAIVVLVAYLSPELAVAEVGTVMAVMMLPGAFVWRRVDRPRVLLWIVWAIAMPVIGLLTDSMTYTRREATAEMHAVGERYDQWVRVPLGVLVLCIAAGFLMLFVESKQQAREALVPDARVR